MLTTLSSTWQVPLSEEQEQCFRGVQHVHREASVHREGTPVRSAPAQLHMVSAACSGRVRGMWMCVYVYDLMGGAL